MYIQEPLAAGIICLCVGAGFFFVIKKDKTLWPCIDDQACRGLNDITVKIPPTSSIQLLKSLHRANIFTKLDLCNTSGRRMNRRWCLISRWVILNIHDSFWTYQCPGGPPSTCEQCVEILLEHFCLCVKNPYMNTRCMFTQSATMPPV